MTHSANEPTLFVPPHSQVTKVIREKAAGGRPTWSKYRPLNAVKCDDCMLALYQAKGEAPASKPARWKRKQGASFLLLCYGHADLWREEDGLTPLKGAAR